MVLRLSKKSENGIMMIPTHFDQVSVYLYKIKHLEVKKTRFKKYYYHKFKIKILNSTDERNESS